MADKEKSPLGKNPRQNYQMWIILALVAVVLVVSYFSRTGDFANMFYTDISGTSFKLVSGATTSQLIVV